MKIVGPIVLISVLLQQCFFWTPAGGENTIDDAAAVKWKPIDKPCLCKEFRCNDGLFCLHAERVCNGSKDCPGGEDEKIEIDGISSKCRRGFKANCTADEFKCKFGDCVKLTQVCDGIPHCWGGVDESIDFCTWVNSK